MEQMFEMSDLGKMAYFFGMEVSQTQHGIFLSQKAFASKILSKFSMLNCKATSTPVALERNYRAKVTLTRFMHCCNEKNFQAAKRVLRYIKGTLSYGMLFSKAESMKLVGNADSDWAGSIDDMKSTSGYVFTLGSTIFCWSLEKQNVVVSPINKRSMWRWRESSIEPYG
ncbi:uncharacterized mitochondrial protein AtMg00810-like [Gossypium raimondii]|uniref:uncharacterized mitochondrial protein AtMg00810-like n=1 Tax=Gossypium raimondii TaxID=29730 RepID=UPI00227CB13D|nr:uncharacterized mitochondrial protein AtMg00810-like [Gossypium raimondii]